MLDVFNNLVKHLRISLDNKSSDEQVRSLEKKFEEDLVNTIGRLCFELVFVFQIHVFRLHQGVQMGLLILK